MYQLIVSYKDCSCKSEHTDSIKSALTAAAIYLEDPDCLTAVIYDTEDKKFILDYYKKGD